MHNFGLDPVTLTFDPVTLTCYLDPQDLDLGPPFLKLASV